MTCLESIRIATESDLPTLLEVDDDATLLYPTAGVVIDLAPGHPFALAERARWAASLARGDVFAAARDAEPLVGFAVMGVVDGAPYLDQLSVRRDAMGRGVGSALIDGALGWARARAGALWLNTYGHLPWNRPFYERRGFVIVPESEWHPEMRAIVEGQREVLPRPDQRVVMRRLLTTA